MVGMRSFHIPEKWDGWNTGHFLLEWNGLSLRVYEALRLVKNRSSPDNRRHCCVFCAPEQVGTQTNWTNQMWGKLGKESKKKKTK